MQRLLIVESPTKAKTIGKYIKDFEVTATAGHLRDLPKSKMGIEVEGDKVKVDYVVSEDKKKIIKGLIAEAKKAEVIYLATDPDREGEAIAWHVVKILEEGLKKKLEEKVKRVSFHEITKEAIEEALKNEGKINQDLVDAQQARRALDRAVGYKLSPVLWKKIRRGLSAGRVQSVAVRLICEREEEREKFKQEKFFKISADFGEYTAELKKVDGKSFVKTEKIKLFDGDYKYSKTIFGNRDEAEKFIDELKNKFRVIKVEARSGSSSPPPPFTTSKLQQAASRLFGWSGKQTMSVAQKLYEKGLITYHRTDSVNLAEKAIVEFGKYINDKFGGEYLVEGGRHFANRSKNAQEAHEAIRPTNVYVETEKIEARDRKLYKLIFDRAVGSQMKAAKLETTKIYMENTRSEFVAEGVRVVFDGYLRLTGRSLESQILPKVGEGDELESKKIDLEEDMTRPPPRYSDATLVASLEKQGIGRPSTYAPIISTILLRLYVERDEGRFKPTVIGVATNKYLATNFEEIVSLPFTAEMEEDLDEIARGKNDWEKMISSFWNKFDGEVKKAEKESERVKIEAEKTGEKCPECKEGDLVIRMGRFGKFISCGRFPECKFAKPFVELAGFKCPECGAETVVKRTKKGRKFFGCSQYPKCKWAGWKKGGK